MCWADINLNFLTVPPILQFSSKTPSKSPVEALIFLISLTSVYVPIVHFATCLIINTPYHNNKLSVQVCTFKITYLDVGNICDKSTDTTLYEVGVQVFLDFPIQASQVNPYH